jgi:hypothetical protein
MISRCDNMNKNNIFYENAKIKRLESLAEQDVEGRADIIITKKNKELVCFIYDKMMDKVKKKMPDSLKISLKLTTFFKKINGRYEEKDVNEATIHEKRLEQTKDKTWLYDITGQIVDLNEEDIVIDCGVYLHIQNRNYGFEVGDWITAYGRMDIHII